MNPSNQHIIGKQQLQINIVSDENHFDLQQRVSTFYWEQVTPVLEQLFDQFADAETLIQLDKLEIDLGTIPLEELETTFVQQLKIQLEEALIKQVQVEGKFIQRQSKSQQHFAQWLYFLKTGTLDWQAKKLEESSLKAVLDTLGLSTIAVQQLAHTIKKQPTALHRLIYQHDDIYLKTIIELFTGKPQNQLPIIHKEWKLWVKQTQKQVGKALQHLGNKQDISFQFWRILLDISINQRVKETTDLLFLATLEQFFAPLTISTKAALLQVAKAKKQALPTCYPLIDKYIVQIEKTPVLKEYWQQPTKTKFADFQTTSRKEPTILTNQEIEVATKIDEKAKKRTKKIKLQEKAPANTENTLAKKPSKKNKLTKKKPSTAIKKQKIHHVQKKKKAIGTIDLAVPFPMESHPKSKILIPQEKEAFKAVKVGSAWYIENAGMVLLHIFLPTIFRNLGWIAGTAFKTETARHRAIHLIQYLATKEQGLPEYELLLAKFLCGLPFDLPIRRKVKLKKKEQKAAEELLAAAIQHWGALGTSSPDALRQGFLQRAGKLEKRRNGWYLCIEKKTLDILLDRLPWSISMIKLPWMTELLRVEWNN